MTTALAFGALIVLGLVAASGPRASEDSPRGVLTIIAVALVGAALACTVLP
jgi:hypothetical protein